MSQIKVQDIVITVEKKNIKNLYLKVLPPDGRVTISAPAAMKDTAVENFALTKIAWIIKQQERYANQAVTPEQQYISGEDICLWGKRYCLEVIHFNTGNKVTVSNNTIFLQVREESTVKQRENVLNEWYREQLKQAIPVLLKKWENIIGVRINSWGIKSMKTRWGTCNVNTGRIWLNLQLAKKALQCLEYVVVHEMVHLLEQSHNADFKAYMDCFLPEWRITRKELNNKIEDTKGQ